MNGAALERSNGTVRAVLGADRLVRFATNARGLSPGERVLRVSAAILEDLPALVEEADLRWAGDLTAAAPADVARSFEGAFNFLEAPDRNQPGLRTPQLGAVHAVLAHWTTGVDVPATVVMPTGTGKTETMVALLAVARPTRLLIVVPSDTLRKQIAGKFETLGVLQETGVIDPRALRPVVGLVAHGFTDPESARRFSDACNVVVTTPSALFASKAEASAALLDRCSHLFIDEAHHVAARTWTQIRDSFAGKPVVQFTATPYREDGRPLGGRAIYTFPLKEAQRLGYFSEIDYTSVVDFADPDRALATRAVERLRRDIELGLDHVLMARANRIGRARDLLGLYEDVASELNPVILHSTLKAQERREGLDLLLARRSRIVVCVDMLGEGFDLPALKVAAIHDSFKSLGVTLQFVGRFARVAGSEIGRASVYVSRTDLHDRDNLRKLYAEDADWNSLISDLSEAAIAEEEAVGEFESGFGPAPDEVTVQSLEPKMSTVVYRTQVDDWNPHAALEIYPEENLLSVPVAVNQDRDVAWFVATVRVPVNWGDLPHLEEVQHHLYVLYWDRARQLLYINSSNTASHHEGLARSVCAETAIRITGDAVYRVMHNLQRPVPTNVGLLDVRNQNRRFSMLMGADVSEGFPAAEATTKTKTNIFASGYESGERVTVGASLKGRIWSHRAARTLKHWVDWCDHIGRKLTDETITTDQVMGAFIRPEVLQARPPLVPLAIEWPPDVWLNTSDETRLVRGTASSPLVEAELRVTEFSNAGPIRFEVRTPEWSAPYEATVENEQMKFRPTREEIFLRRARSDVVALSQYFEKAGPLLILEQDAMIIAPALLLQPQRDVPPYPTEELKDLDWTGIDLSKESQGAARDATSIQARVIQHLRDVADWDVVLDDDGTGEVADVVAMRVDGEYLRVLLAHCKYAAGGRVGARVQDLYEVCGQAQKSVRWRHYVDDMFRRLIKRERDRSQRHNRTGFEVGEGQDLYRLHDESRLLRPDFTIVIAQPGLPKSRVSVPQLHLLGTTDLYISEVAAARFHVLCNH